MTHRYVRSKFGMSESVKSEWEKAIFQNRIEKLFHITGLI